MKLYVHSLVDKLKWHNRVEIFQKKSRLQPFWPQKERRDFGIVESRTSWGETKRIQIKLCTTFFLKFCWPCICLFISVINQLDVQNFCFTISSFHASTCFEHYVLIIRRSKLHYTAAGIITLKQVSGLKVLKYNSINMSK